MEELPLGIPMLQPASPEPAGEPLWCQPAPATPAESPPPQGCPSTSDAGWPSCRVSSPPRLHPASWHSPSWHWPSSATCELHGAPTPGPQVSFPPRLPLLILSLPISSSGASSSSSSSCRRCHEDPDLFMIETSTTVLNVGINSAYLWHCVLPLPWALTRQEQPSPRGQAKNRHMLRAWQLAGRHPVPGYMQGRAGTSRQKPLINAKFWKELWPAPSLPPPANLLQSQGQAEKHASH